MQHMIISNLAFLLPSVAATLLNARLGRSHQLGARVRRAWWLLSAGFFMYFAGNLLYTYQELTLDMIPFPSLADGMFLLSFPLWLWGVLTFPTEDVADHDRSTLWLDSGIVVVGFGSVLWVLVLQPTITAEYEDWLGAAVSLAFPLSSLLLLFSIVVIIYRRPVDVSQSAFYWLGISFFCFTVADTIYGYLSLQGSYYSGLFWTDSIYALAGLTAVVASQVQQWHIHTSNMPISQEYWLRWFRILLPYASVTLSYSLLISIAYDQINTVLGQTVLVAVGLTVLVILSQARANQATWRAQSEAEVARAALADSAAQLAQTNAELEQRVTARTAELEQALVAQEAQAAELRESIAIQEQLSATIVAQSVPVIPVRGDALVAPIIGVIDSQRAELILRTILQVVEQQPAVRIVFLDVTGVAMIDTASAQMIIQVVSAVRLLGAELVLVGVRPELAQTLVDLQIDLTQFRTVATLQQGLGFIKG